MLRFLAFTLLVLAIAIPGQVSAATFSVTNTNDSGAGSLRQAIIDANANADSDTINIQATGTIELLSALPSITSSVVINGPGASSLTVDVNGTGIGFAIFTGATVTIRDLTVTGASGGGIINGGTAILEDLVVTGNTTAIAGAGVASISASNSTLTRVRITNNNATGSGLGGGLWLSVNATVVVNDSLFEDNTADNFGGGIGTGNLGGQNLTINNSTIRGNAAGSGGGLAILGGTVVINDSHILNNDATVFAGGGIHNQANLTVRRSRIGGNGALILGGGVHNTGTFLMESSTIRNNQTMQAGGPGAGLSNQGSASLTNVTISDNRTFEGGGGGGIFNCSVNCDDSGAPLDLVNVTIANNTAAFGGGIANDDPAVTLRNVLLDNNSSGNCSVPLTSGNNNLSSDATCAFGSGDNADLNLGPLADNGGPTETHALLTGSDAIDAGSNSGCPDEDQRGVNRPEDGDDNGSEVCDVGAYEVEGPEPTPVPATPEPTQPAQDRRPAGGLGASLAPLLAGAHATATPQAVAPAPAAVIRPPNTGDAGLAAE